MRFQKLKVLLEELWQPEKQFVLHLELAAEMQKVGDQRGAGGEVDGACTGHHLYPSSDRARYGMEKLLKRA